MQRKFGALRYTCIFRKYFMFDFRSPWWTRKIFNNENFPNYGNAKRVSTSNNVPQYHSPKLAQSVQASSLHWEFPTAGKCVEHQCHVTLITSNWKRWTINHALDSGTWIYLFGSSIIRHKVIRTLFSISKDCRLIYSLRLDARVLVHNAAGFG